MASRLDLHKTLLEINGGKNVYHQPPESVKMAYDAIRYSRKSIKSRHANNAVYSRMNCYELTVISRDPDCPLVDKILELPYCSFDRQYPADNLNHFVFTLYY